MMQLAFAIFGMIMLSGDSAGAQWLGAFFILCAVILEKLK